MSNMKTCLMCGESAKPIESRATQFCSERCHRHWKTCGAALWNEAMWRVQATELCDECEDQRSANNNNKEQSMSRDDQRYGYRKRTRCFGNGYGSSVIRHSGSYGSDRGLYELAVINSKTNRLHYTSPITGDVLGWLTLEDVQRINDEIAALPHREFEGVDIYYGDDYFANNNKEQSMSEMKAVSPFGNEVPCVETWDDHLWALCDEFGPRVFVTADTFENAWEEAVDALPAIPADEVHEAYGFDTDEELAAAASKADRRENESPGTYGEQRGEDQTPSLAEGYEYQSNATGTGIVWVGYHATLVCPTSDMLPEQWRGTKLSVTIADRVFTVECEEVE